MIVKRVALQNFLSYQKRCDVDLDGKHTVGVVGPNECLHGDMPIYDPIAGTTDTVAARYKRGEPFHVFALGPRGVVIAAAGPPRRFTKEQMLRIVGVDGLTVTATPGHRVWNGAEWEQVASIFQRRRSGQVLLPTISALGLAARAVGGSHWKGTVRGCKADCPRDCRCDDEPPPSAVVDDRASVPSRDGARGRTRADQRQDGPALARGHSRPRRRGDHLSSSDCAASVHRNRERLRRQHVSQRQPVPGSTTAQSQSRRAMLLLRTSAELEVCGQWSIEMHCPSASAAPLVGSIGNCTKDGTDVRDVIELGCSYYYDFHVPIFNNYWACGFFHHNSGKSGILQAISYGLFGKTRAEREVQLINDNADGDLLVEVAARLHDGSTIEVTRGRTAKNEAILKLAGFAGKTSDVEAEIATRLRLSYEDFVSLAYFVQGDIHQFMLGDKREYFTRWTAGLAQWAQFEDRAGVKLDDAEDRTRGERARLANAQAVLEDAEATRQEVEAANAAITEARRKVARLHKEQAALRAAEQAVTQAQSVAVELEGVIDDYRRTLGENARYRARLIADLTRATREIADLTAGICPVLKKRCEELAGSTAPKLAQAEKRLGALRKEQADLDASSAATTEKLTAAQQRLAELPAEAPVPADHQTVADDLEDAEAAVRQAEARHTRVLVAQERIAQAAGEEAVANVNLEKLDTELRRMQFLKFMCGKSGIPALLIERELARVEERCNWILERLDYPKQIRFQAFKELAGWEAVCPTCGSESWRNGACAKCAQPRPHKRKDEPTVTVLDGQNERPFALESGGAQVLQSFAVRLASSLFRSAMTGVPMKMVMLDEVFGMLDASNRQKLLALVVDKLANEFGLEQQLVVSHQDDVVNAVDDLLVVTRERGGSVARWE